MAKPSSCRFSPSSGSNEQGEAHRTAVSNPAAHMAAEADLVCSAANPAFPSPRRLHFLPASWSLHFAFFLSLAAASRSSICPSGPYNTEWLPNLVYWKMPVRDRIHLHLRTRVLTAPLSLPSGRLDELFHTRWSLLLKISSNHLFNIYGMSPIAGQDQR